MSEHTPGPWEIRLEKDGRVEGIYTTKLAPEDVEISGEFAGKIVETDGGIYPPKLPDARLIAAAPELLEALKNLEKEFRRVYPIYYYAEPWGHETNVPLQAARAAIGKATGEEIGN